MRHWLAEPTRARDWAALFLAGFVFVAYFAAILIGLAFQ